VSTSGNMKIGWLILVGWVVASALLGGGSWQVEASSSPMPWRSSVINYPNEVRNPNASSIAVSVTVDVDSNRTCIVCNNEQVLLLQGNAFVCLSKQVLFVFPHSHSVPSMCSPTIGFV
jgi:hypothetical protein